MPLPLNSSTDRLVGVPGFKEVYHEELDRENWGLIKAAQVDSYKGFIFACMDPEAPDLDVLVALGVDHPRLHGRQVPVALHRGGVAVDAHPDRVVDRRAERRRPGRIPGRR